MKKPPKGPTKGPGGWGPVFLRFIDDLIKGLIIVELGSGLGTREITKRGHVVHSVEHDREWLGVAGDAIYHHAPIKNGWYNPDFIKDLPQKYDVLIIDGPPGTIGREGFKRHASLFDLSALIVVDDVNRPAEMDLAKWISKTVNRGMSVYKDGIKSFAVI